MDIKKLLLFADVAETENFTKTGDRMGYTQSGVSHLLKSLEDEIGFSLFIRSKQGVKLTENARAILPGVRSLLAMTENLEQIINEINGLEKGQLVIATFASISIHWLPKIIHVFQENHPNIRIKLMEGGTDDIVNWIETDLVDFGFVSKRNTKTLDWIPLYEDPLYAVVPLDYPAPPHKVFPIENFEGQRFIISATGTDYDVHHVLNSAGVKPHIDFTSKDDHAIISMIKSELGISILPGLTLRYFESQVSFYPLQPFFTRTLGVAMKSRKNLTPAAVKFLKLTKDMMPELI